MDYKTKQEALLKLDKMKPLVAYPKELLDDEMLDNYHKMIVIDKTSFLKTNLNLNIFSNNLAVQLLEEPVDPFDWTGVFGRASTTNAFYSPTSNSISLFLYTLTRKST